MLFFAAGRVAVVSVAAIELAVLPVAGLAFLAECVHVWGQVLSVLPFRSSNVHSHPLNVHSHPLNVHSPSATSSLPC